MGAGNGEVCQRSVELLKVQEKPTLVLGRKGQGRRVRMKGTQLAQRKDFEEGWAGRWCPLQSQPRMLRPQQEAGDSLVSGHAGKGGAWCCLVVKVEVAWGDAGNTNSAARALGWNALLLCAL